MNRLLVNGTAAIVVGFGAGWAAISMATSKVSPPAARAASLVIGTPTPDTETKSFVSAPQRDTRAEAANPPPPAVAAPAPASKTAPKDKEPSKSTSSERKPGGLRFKAQNADVSASVDPDGRKLRVRTPFGSYNFGL